MTSDYEGRKVLERISHAGVLFKDGVSRRELALLRAGWPCRSFRIRPHRNHSFEHVVAASSAWASYAKIRTEWQEAAYDDALTMALHGEAPDLEVIWYDVDVIRGKLGDGIVEWMKSRIKFLRAASPSPILVVLIGLARDSEVELANYVHKMPGVRVAPVYDVISALRNPFDARMAKIAGARLSEEANLAIAKNMACRWLPAMLLPRMKAVVVDLDQTMYSGVLGEDGLEVGLTPAHEKLHFALRGLKESGMFLGIVSKNEPADVDELFAKRQDFPLRAADFSAVEVGWGSKSESLKRVCQTLRIDPSAVLYIDDNPGELLEVAGNLPAIELMHAGHDVYQTVRELDYYPGIWSWGVSAADLLRVADLSAETLRKSIKEKTSDQQAYLKELAPELDVWINPPALVGRLAELSRKTNQFNLSLSRLDEVQVSDYVTSEKRFAVAIGLRDRLSDSGIVAAMFGSIDEGQVVVNEWVISCRALGRGLETLMASSALEAICGQRTTASFNYSIGPRNKPARDWLESLTGAVLSQESSLQVKLPLLSKVADSPVRINLQANERPNAP
jgi:FkbH-like protein